MALYATLIIFLIIFTSSFFKPFKLLENYTTFVLEEILSFFCFFNCSSTDPHLLKTKFLCWKLLQFCLEKQRNFKLRWSEERQRVMVLILQFLIKGITYIIYCLSFTMLTFYNLQYLRFVIHNFLLQVSSAFYI